MNILNRISTENTAQKIAEELTKDTADTNGYDLGFLFISSALNQDAIQELTQKIRQITKVKYLLACSCWGIIGPYREIEQQAAASIILIQLPGVKVNPFYFDQDRLTQLNKSEDWYDFLDVYPNEKPVFFVLPDPFLVDINQFLDGINKAYLQCPVLGGLASGGAQSKENTLILNEKTYDEGLIGVYLTGNIQVDSIVSQGCRPLGKSYIVTKADRNIIYELAGRPLYEVLLETIEKSSAEDQKLAQEAILVGIAMNEYKHELKRGDFLIRMLIGIDEKSGAAAISDYIHVGQTIQFHVRDSVSSTEDLNELLLQHTAKTGANAHAQAALIFSCNGRGKNLFKEKDHDITIIKKHVGAIPMAGFFCAGEIGPVGGRNFIHGFTSSIALFYSKT